MANCKVIAVTSQKGGVGITATTANLGIGLAQQNKRVLLIDTDAQGSLTLSLGYPKPDELPVTLADIMQNVIDDTPIPDGCGILHHGEGVDLLPANIELSGMEIRLINAMSRESVLRTYINAVKPHYDYIVTVALSQVGNLGGQPYWSWYGFDSRVEWCACFVSWCANECGYIDSGVIPNAGCVNGVQWFKDREQWQDGSFEPSAGQIIFFDWDNKGSSGPQDGQADHVGIVEKCENGIVYTVEGNSGDSCRQNQYPEGHYEILGYGVPAY